MNRPDAEVIGGSMCFQGRSEAAKTVSILEKG